MNRFYPLYTLLVFGLICGRAHAQSAVTNDTPPVRSFTQRPKGLQFAENKGQVADLDGHLRTDILFSAHSEGTTIFLTANTIHYQMERVVRPGTASGSLLTDLLKDDLSDATRQTHRLTLSLLGANPSPRIRKEEQSSCKENFYLAHCPDGITGVRSYGKLVYEQVYPNIDWVLYGKGSGMKYEFVVHPGGDPSLIRLQVTDASSVAVSEEGELVIKSGLGEIREAPPVSFAGDNVISTQFVQDANGVVHFRLGRYPAGETLVIDPVISWLTYQGGTFDEWGMGTAINPVNGDCYLTGFTYSPTGIAGGGFQNSYGGNCDAFISRYDAGGNRLWSTYYGGSSMDQAVKVCLSNNGSMAYVMGSTASSSAISYMGFQNTLNAGAPGFATDAFLVKFNNAGLRIWGTYIGGAGFDEGYGCTVDPLGQVYVSGVSNSSTNISTPGAHQTQFSAYTWRERSN